MAPSLGSEQLVCAHCGVSGAPALCSGCRLVRYCGPECQRAAWRAGHRVQCTSKRQASKPSTTLESEQRWPVRCPQSIIKTKLPRLDRIDCQKAQDMMCEGQAFVAPASGLLGTQLLKWDFPYLAAHLPQGQKYGVMYDEGSGKIVMSHTARNGMRHVSKDEGPAKQVTVDAAFNTSDQTRMTFQEFLDETERYKRSGGAGKLPYFGLHLLWRFKEGENGFVGEIDEDMQDDMWSINFKVIKEWQDANLLPLIQRFYLFAGLGGTLYHCHYDLQPNLHVQLTGRKRFIIFPPEDWRHLYPFPVHHDLDRRSMVDLDRPDTSQYPMWSGAHGAVVELNPGDALYIPPYWWHHVQSISPKTTSMAMWFFEKFPQSASIFYGVGERAEGVGMMRDIEEYIGKNFPDEPGEEDCTKARPVKAKQVANYVEWLKHRLGLGLGTVDQSMLSQLTCTPEKLESSILEVMGDYGENFATVEARRERLQSLFKGRF